MRLFVLVPSFVAGLAALLCQSALAIDPPPITTSTVTLPLTVPTLPTTSSVSLPARLIVDGVRLEVFQHQPHQKPFPLTRKVRR